MIVGQGYESQVAINVGHGGAGQFRLAAVAGLDGNA